MQLIFGKDNAEKLRERYVVLDLETVEKDGVSIEVYCLIPGDKIGLPDMPQIDNWTKLHHEMMDGFHTQQYKYVRDAIEHLMGKFGGEVDTFYTELLGRIDKAESE